jgi:mono/diheme cytochrome c family protein
MNPLDRIHPLLAATLVAGCSVVSALSLGRFAESEPVSRAISFPVEAGSASHGRQLFIQSCAHCHGDDARGNGEEGDGPDLFRLRIGNARIAAVIRTGIPDEMPSFTKKYATPQITDLTAYLRTLQ